MYFKLCQRCERFFYSDAEYKSHSCFQNEKKRIPSPAASSVAEEEKTKMEPVKPAAENQDRKQILIAMKAMLGNKKIECATLKFEKTKELFLKAFGDAEYQKLEKSMTKEA